MNPVDIEALKSKYPQLSMNFERVARFFAEHPSGEMRHSEVLDAAYGASTEEAGWFGSVLAFACVTTAMEAMGMMATSWGVRLDSGELDPREWGKLEDIPPELSGCQLVATLRWG